MNYRDRSLKEVLEMVGSEYEGLITSSLPNSYLHITTIGNLLDLEDLNLLTKGYGFGDVKLEKAKALKEFLSTLSDSDFIEKQETRYEISSSCQNIPLFNLLQCKLIDTQYESIINNVLANHSIRTINDILTHPHINRLKGVGKSKLALINQLKEELKYLLENSQDDVERAGALHKILPQSGLASDSPAVLFTKFIQEFCELIPDERIRQNKRRVFYGRYIEGFGRDILASEANQTRQNIDNTIDAFRNFIFQNALIANTELPNCVDQYGVRFGFSDLFVEKFKDASEKADKCPTIEDFAREMGCKRNAPIMTFILDILGKRICSNIRTELKDDFVSGVKANQMTDAFGVVFDRLYEIIAPYNKLFLRRDIKQKCKNIKPETLDTVCKIIESSTQFEVIDNDCYQFKWSELSSIQAKVERILFENKGEMSNESIVDEINRRSLVAGIKPTDNPIWRTSKKIQDIKGGGYWIWYEYIDNTSTHSLKEEVSRYIAEHKTVTLNEVVAHAVSIYGECNEKSIRGYVTNLCYQTQEEIFVYKGSRKEYSQTYHFFIPKDQLLEELIEIFEVGQSYTAYELQSRYEKHYCLLAGKKPIYNICYDNNEFFANNRRKGTKQSEFKLIKSKREILDALCHNSAEKFNKVERRSPHLRLCRMEAISALRYASDYCLPMEELSRRLKDFMPKKIALNGVYKIFDENIFIKEKSDDSKKTKIRLNLDVYRKEYNESISENSTNVDQEARTAISRDSASKHNHTDILYTLSYPKDYKIIKESLSVQLSKNLDWIANDNMAIDFESAWEQMLKIMDIEKEGPDGVYKRLFTRLYVYLFHHTNSIERFDLYRDLILDFETYLRSILGIQDIGLKTIIHSAQEEKLLPQKEQRCTITKYISNLIKRRNNLSHTGGKTEAEVSIALSINETITLFLYAAYKAQKLQ